LETEPRQRCRPIYVDQLHIDFDKKLVSSHGEVGLEDGIRIKPITPPIGAGISGPDLSHQELNSYQMKAAVAAAFHRYEGVCDTTEYLTHHDQT
jgi:hypothetical protein